jgi:uncharacterized membrane protein
MEVLSVVVISSDLLHFGLGVSVLIVTHFMYISLPIAMLAYAWLRFGRAFAVVSAPVLFFGGITVEVVGTRTGFPFGAYYYTASFQPQVFGVPLEIALGWLTLGLMCYSLASLGRRSRGSVAVFGALLMVAWDVLYDPVFTGLGMWVWRQGSYFTVPTSNFAGWFLTSMFFFLLISLVKGQAVSKLDRASVLAPLCVYFSYLVDGSVSNISLNQGLASAIGASLMLALGLAAVAPGLRGPKSFLP